MIVEAMENIESGRRHRRRPWLLDCFQIPRIDCVRQAAKALEENTSQPSKASNQAAHQWGLDLTKQHFPPHTSWSQTAIRKTRQKPLPLTQLQQI